VEAEGGACADVQDLRRMEAIAIERRDADVPRLREGGVNGARSVYGRTRSWLGSRWHDVADDESEFTQCGMKLPLEVLDEAPPPPEMRCAQCDNIAHEIALLTELFL
jgi:hypothetical protein